MGPRTVIRGALKGLPATLAAIMVALDTGMLELHRREFSIQMMEKRMWSGLIFGCGGVDLLVRNVMIRNEG